MEELVGKLNAMEADAIRSLSDAMIAEKPTAAAWYAGYIAAMKRAHELVLLHASVFPADQAKPNVDLETAKAVGWLCAECPDGAAVFWNPGNGVVQCHRCGEAFKPACEGLNAAKARARQKEEG